MSNTMSKLNTAIVGIQLKTLGVFNIAVFYVTGKKGLIIGSVPIFCNLASPAFHFYLEKMRF